MKDKRAMLFVGALFSNEDFYRKALARLNQEFGPSAHETPAAQWDYSRYYEEELGSPILRKFVFFDGLIPQDAIGKIKLKTVEIEAEFSADGKRNINIDPGYVTEAKVVLASTKDYSHRVCIVKGIYAEVALVFKKGVGFRPHQFTYRDYVDNADVFHEARNAFRKKLTV